MVSSLITEITDGTKQCLWGFYNCNTLSLIWKSNNLLEMNDDPTLSQHNHKLASHIQNTCKPMPKRGENKIVHVFIFYCEVFQFHATRLPF